MTTTDHTAPSLATGWDTRLAELAAGLDLDQWADRVMLAARIARAADMDTLRALARWLAPATHRASTPDRLALRIAEGWHREVGERASTAARLADGTSLARRIPAADDDQPF